MHPACLPILSSQKIQQPHRQQTPIHNPRSIFHNLHYEANQPSPLGHLTTTLGTPLVRRDDGVSCVGVDKNALFQWAVVVNNDSKYDPTTCGAGFLDNLRGRCSVITDWACDIGDNDSANMAFDTNGWVHRV
jgi:hypothetical protein